MTEHSETKFSKLLPDELETPPLSLSQLTWRRFRRHKMAIFGAVTLILLVFYTFGGMLVFSEADSNFVETGNRLAAPSPEHPFGTDTVGISWRVRSTVGRFPC